MQLIDKIKNIARQNYPQVVAARRHIHAHPELSFQEFNTAAYIEEFLKKIGITTFERKAGTGVVALIEGKNPDKKCIALRADMDALPITEANRTDYISVNQGIMHACGHDVHTASLLGCAAILQELRNDFSGTVKLIFQPGEEKSPGGASLLIKEKTLENPTPVSIIGQHVAPNIPVGKVGFRQGIYMASADEVYLKIIGKGGHAAMPEFLVDPVVVASHIIIALQQIVSRNASPKIPTVLSFGKVIANGATNVIPNEVTIEGTLRTLNESWRAKAKENMVKMATSLAESMGATCEVTFNAGYPYLENNPELTAQLQNWASEYVGAENVENLDISLTAEDFAFYTHHLPACFYRLGVRNESKGITSAVHTPTFDIDEDALLVGSGLMAWLTIKQLS